MKLYKDPSDLVFGAMLVVVFQLLMSNGVRWQGFFQIFRDLHRFTFYGPTQIP